jgi:hypothetical protein
MTKREAEDLGWVFYLTPGDSPDSEEPAAKKRFNESLVYKQLPTEEALLADIETWELAHGAKI